MKKLLLLLLAACTLPCMADKCEDCGTYIFDGRLCNSCARARRESADNAALGLGALFLSGMAENAKEQAAAEAKRKAEEAKRIAAENEKLLQESIELELIDPDEGRHNLGVQFIPIPSSSSIPVISGTKDEKGQFVVSSLSADLLELPSQMRLVNKALPNSVDICVIRRSSSSEANGKWLMKNVPFRFFYRGANKLSYQIQLISEDEVSIKITAYPQQKELANVTLVNDQVFDFAVESGVDGQGLQERTYKRGIGSDGNTSSVKGGPKKPRRRKISW